MSDKKLTLAVDFVGVDKMSSTTRALAASSTATRDKIKGLKDEIGRLNKSLGDTKSLRAATESLKKHKTATREAAEKLAALKAQIVAGEAPTKKLVTSIQSAEKHLSKMQDAEKKAASSAKELVSTMRGAGVDIARLGQHEASLTSRVEQANRSLKQQNSLLEGNERRLRSVMRNERLANSQHQRREENARQYVERQGNGRWSTSGRSGAEVASTAFNITKNLADVGASYEALIFRLRVLGLSAKSAKDLTEYSDRTDIPGASRLDKLRIISEAQAVFRETGRTDIEKQLEGAKLMMPHLAHLLVTQKALGQEFSPDQEKYLLRVIEQQGGLGSPARAAEITGGLFKALASSNGIVTPENYQTFLAAAKAGGNKLSAQSLFADFEPIIAEMGERAGTGLSTAFKRATAITSNSKAADEYMRLGLWDRSKVVLNSLGGVKKTNGNPLKAEYAAMLQNSPVDFYQKVILPAYEKAGIKDRTWENARLFGDTGGSLFNQIDKMGAQFFKDARATYAGTMSLDDSYKMASTGFLGQSEQLKAATEDFKVAATESGDSLKSFTSTVKWATDFLKSSTPASGTDNRNWSWFGPSSPQPKATGPVPKGNWATAKPANSLLSPGSASIRPAASAAGAPAARGPVTLNVYGAPGQSETELARKVMLQMNHAQGVKTRSDMNGGDGR